MHEIPTLLAAVLMLALPAPSREENAAPPRLDLETCRLPGLAEDVKCGTYEVFENRAARAGRKISLRVVVLPARDADPAPDPVFYFSGGPGGSAVAEAPGLSFLLDEVRRRRDLVLVDQRGTGKSNPLFCPYQERDQGIEEALESFLPSDGVRECRAALEKRADLAHYTTADAVDDFDEVRAALGYEQVNLMGGSYGSRVVLTYLRRHPEAVRTAVIEGVVPFDAKSPLTFARDAQRALDGIFAECAADEGCHRAFPDPRADLRTVVARLREKPVKATVVDPNSGEEKTLELSHNVFIQTLRYMTYDPLSSLEVPLYLRLAAAGDFAPLAQTAYSVAGGLLHSLPDGLFLSVTCAEDVAFIDPAEVASSVEGTYLGDFRVRQQRAACAYWPRAAVPAGFTEPVRSAKPVLVISGERDPVTPAAWGEAVASHLAHSRHVVVPDGAHGFFGLEGSKCLERLSAELFERGDVAGLDVAACAGSIHRPPFPLELARDEAIDLGEDELRRFEGSYVLEQGGFEMVVELVEGRLRAALGDDHVFLVPVGPLRFRVEGAPAGSYVGFTAEGEAIGGAEIIQRGRTLFVLRRKP